MSWTFKIENGDLVRTQGGNGYTVLSGKKRLVQDCKMILSTDIRSNGVGSSLSRILGKTDMVGAEISEGMPLMFEFQQMVKKSISRYIVAQRSLQYDRRLFSEMLDDSSSVMVSPDPDDPRKFKWRVDFYTVASSSNFALGGTSLR